MAECQIRFNDGAAYERMMGTWSRIAGAIFIDWLAPPSGLRWIDVGCGNGGFSELLVERCAPAEVQGINPSEAQLAFARTRPGARLTKFDRGDAMALPVSDDAFDAATMALVIFLFAIRPKALPRWCALCARAARSRLTLGTRRGFSLGANQGRDAGDRADASRPAKH
jgi:ubiquinone/menaquinone biosynthesis C-methylase UbiE